MLAMPAFAGPPERLRFGFGQSVVLDLRGEVDLSFQHVDPIAITPVDDRDATLPGDASAFARLRWSPSLTVVDREGFFTVWRIQVEADLLHDWWLVGDDREWLAADPRGRSQTGLIGQRLGQAFVIAAGQHLAIAAGLMRSHWGLGLVANGGDDPRVHTAESPFGYSLQGDHVVRLGVSTFPLGAGLTRPPLAVSLALDGVVDDDTARWMEGDRAYQFVAAVTGQLEWLSLGVYAAYRSQTHHQGGITEVTALDVTGKLRLAKEDGLEVYLEGELATIRGRTSLIESVNDLGSANVEQNGALARLSIAAGPFLGVLEVGGSSGDNNTFDDDQRAFAMDRDHRVGLIMFREAFMANAAVTVANIADADYRGEAPRGSERLATQGAVRGVMYANPRASFRIIDDLHLYLGFLYGTTDSEYVDAFWSGLAGGAPRGPRNGRPASDLGWELDAGVAWSFTMQPELTWRLRLEGAWFSPGGVFDDAAGNAAPDVGGVWLHAGLLW